ncbi:fusion protein [Pseudorhizobium endolithicum]|uniref:Fusion protein n=1 Tax=Pseudorhizobium endolithicum TaxID=1191678 RepID=A0ABM8PCG2_9HYPH|nr:hypothetical protein [Pseudorhizobium endolithicum]CAD7023112.1 fusion protein [Pseudorhizobium endolithicum]
MATSYYSTGTVSLTNGSAVVTGNGTLWQTALIAGGNIIVEAEGNILPIASVDSETKITAELKWMGATGSYGYAIQRDTAYLKTLDRNSETVAYLLDEIRKGTIFKYDASGTLAERAAYNAQPKGFSYLVLAGTTARLYVKASNTSGDWLGPFNYGAGPVGPAPTLGIGTVTTRTPEQSATASVSGSGGAYTLNFGIPRGVQGFKGWAIEPEVVPHGSKQVLRVADFIGGEGAKPAGVGLYVGLGGLVTDIEDAIDIRGDVGPQGQRGITWRGAWGSASEYISGDLVTDDDAEGQPATWIASTTNTNSRPRDNPLDWQYFPGSVPRVQDYGLITDAADITRDYGGLAA